uniref:Uncharacterized protein n=1 Tax=Anopheles culicifacies TaxID=139723 RepID=A0A182M3X9_9DIPT
MSSLRKSASFRSRIPVRRTRLPHRRCTSPADQSVGTAIGHSHGSESSIATGGPNDAGAGLFGKVVGQQPKAWYDRSHCYSSSSYTSSDESYDSEPAPFQVSYRNGGEGYLFFFFGVSARTTTRPTFPRTLSGW